MNKNNFDFIKPIFSSLASTEAIAKALVAFKKRCDIKITLNEAIEQVKEYKKKEELFIIKENIPPVNTYHVLTVFFLFFHNLKLPYDLCYNITKS